MTEKQKPKRTKGDKGRIEKIEYDPAVLLETWKNLGEEPTAERLWKKLNADGLKCSFAWVKKKVTEHNIVALGAMVGLEDETVLLHVAAIKRFLTSIGKDVDPHEMLQGLQVRTITVITSHLNSKDVTKVDPEWLKAMMDAYRAMGEEVLRSYQKRVAAGDATPLPQAKVDDEKVTPFTGRRK